MIMPIPRYEYTGPLDHTAPIDTSKSAGKSIIITGGANGMGEACVRAFVAAGANVTIADVNERGHNLVSELNTQHNRECAVFIKADIRDWDQQKAMFDLAVKTWGFVDVVIANAGISRSSGDSLWNLDDPKGSPTKPDLNIVEVNLRGTFFTWKLAVFYFRQQPENMDRDRCFIITGSMVGWIDSPVCISHLLSVLLLSSSGVMV